MQQLEAKLIEVVKHHGSESAEATHCRNLIAKRFEELKKAYRGVTVELADLHDRPERMLLKNAVQHVVDLTTSRNLFYEIFSVESAKVHLCEMYLERAARNTTRQEAYRWVSDRFEEFYKGITSLHPVKQKRYLEKFANSESFCRHLDEVRADSMERDLLTMTEQEMRNIKELLERCAAQRKISL